ncbi:DUF4870 domain-containing protein [Thermomonas sp.]|uniref:DUF4870 domain-containing protein n=1 Tax=Thermomonas sp. TaxID=1971895 RepID=UPI002486D44D|nr:DUF4870 domain-containing protein [Thermomonas sp.]MDI1252090.1 DUF4870 domain-containing protein [Thermomonas sp.]
MDINEATAAPPPPSGAPIQEDKTLALLTHLSGIILSFIVPLIIWLTNKDKADKGWLNDQAKEALNFQITIAMAYVICTVLVVILIGGLLAPIVWLINVIFCIIAGMKANEGVAYRYPFAIRLIK